MNVEKNIDGSYGFLWSCARVFISCMLIVQMSIPAVLAEVNAKQLSEAESVKKVEKLFEVEVVESKAGGVLILKAQSERIFSGISEAILAKAIENKIGQRGADVKRIRIEFKQCAWEKESFCEIELLTDKDPGFGDFWKGFFKGLKDQAFAEGTNSAAIIFGLLGYAAGGPAAQALLIARVMKAATVVSIAWLIIDFKQAMDDQDYERAGELLGRALVLTIAATVSFKIAKGFRKSGGGVKVLPGRVIEAKPNGTPNKGLPPKPHGSTPVKNPPVKGVTVTPKTPASPPVQGKSMGGSNSATQQMGGKVIETTTEVMTEPAPPEVSTNSSGQGSGGSTKSPKPVDVGEYEGSQVKAEIQFVPVIRKRDAHDAFVAWRTKISSETEPAKLNAIRQMLWDSPNKINEHNVNPAATEYLVNIAEVVFKGKEEIARVIPDYVKHTAEAIKDPIKRAAFITRVDGRLAQNKVQSPWVKEARKVTASYDEPPSLEEAQKDDLTILGEALMRNKRTLAHVSVMLRYAEMCRTGQYKNDNYCEKLRYFYYLWASQAGRVKKDEGQSSLSEEETAKRKKKEEEEAKERAREEASLSAQAEEYVQAQIEYVSEAIAYLENLKEEQMPVLLDVLESIENELQRKGKKLGDYIVEIAVAIYHTHKTGHGAIDNAPASFDKMRAIARLKAFFVSIGVSQDSAHDIVRKLSDKNVRILGGASESMPFDRFPLLLEDAVLLAEEELSYLKDFVARADVKKYLLSQTIRSVERLAFKDGAIDEAKSDLRLLANSGALTLLQNKGSKDWQSASIIQKLKEFLGGKASPFIPKVTRLCSTELFREFCSDKHQKNLLYSMVKTFVKKQISIERLITLAQSNPLEAIAPWSSEIERLNDLNYSSILTYLKSYRDKQAKKKLQDEAAGFLQLFAKDVRILGSGAYHLNQIILDVYGAQNIVVLRNIFFGFAERGRSEELLGRLRAGSTLKTATLSWIISTLLKSNTPEIYEIGKQLQSWQKDNLGSLVKEVKDVMQKADSLDKIFGPIPPKDLQLVLEDLIQRGLIDELVSKITSLAYYSARNWLINTYKNHRSPAMRAISAQILQYNDYSAAMQAKKILALWEANASNASFQNSLSKLFVDLKSEETRMALRLVIQASKEAEFLSAIAEGDIERAEEILDVVLDASGKQKNMLKKIDRRRAWKSGNLVELMKHLAMLRASQKYSGVILEVLGNLSTNEIEELFGYMIENDYMIHFGNLIDEFKVAAASHYLVNILSDTSDHRLFNILEKILASHLASLNNRTDKIFMVIKNKALASASYQETYEYVVKGLADGERRQAIMVLVRVGIEAEFLGALARNLKDEAKNILIWSLSRDRASQALLSKIDDRSINPGSQDPVDRFEAAVRSSLVMQNSRIRVLGNMSREMLKRLILAVNQAMRSEEFMTLLSLGEGHEDGARTLLYQVLSHKDQDIARFIDEQRARLVAQDVARKAEARLKTIESELIKDSVYKINWEMIFSSFSRAEVLEILGVLMREQAEEGVVSEIRKGQVESAVKALVKYLARSQKTAHAKKLSDQQQSRITLKVSKIIEGFKAQAEIFPWIDRILNVLFEGKAAPERIAIYRIMALHDDESRFYGFIVNSEYEEAEALLNKYLQKATTVPVNKKDLPYISLEEFEREWQKILDKDKSMVTSDAAYFFDGLTQTERKALILWLVEKKKAALLLKLVGLGAINAAINIVTRGLSGAKDQPFVEIHIKFKQKRNNDRKKNAYLFLNEINAMAETDEDGAYIRDHIMIGLLPDEEKSVLVYLSEHGRLEEIRSFLRSDLDVDEKVSQIQDLVLTSLGSAQDQTYRDLGNIIRNFRRSITRNKGSHPKFNSEQRELVVDKIIKKIDLPANADYKNKVFKSRSGEKLTDAEIETMITLYFSSHVTTSKLEMYNEIEFWIERKDVTSFKRRLGVFLGQNIQNPEIRILYAKYFDVSLDAEHDYDGAYLLNFIDDLPAYDLAFDEIERSVTKAALKAYFENLNKNLDLSVRLQRKKEILGFVEKQDWISFQETLIRGMSSIGSYSPEEKKSVETFLDFMKLVAAEAKALKYANEQVALLEAYLAGSISGKTAMDTIFEDFGALNGNPKGEMLDVLIEYFKPTISMNKSGNYLTQLTGAPKAKNMITNLEADFINAVVAPIKTSLASRLGKLPPRFKIYLDRLRALESRKYARSKEGTSTPAFERDLSVLMALSKARMEVFASLIADFDSNLLGSILRAVVNHKLSGTWQEILKGKKAGIKAALESLVDKLAKSPQEEDRFLSEYLKVSMAGEDNDQPDQTTMTPNTTTPPAESSGDVEIPQSISRVAQWTVVETNQIKKAAAKLPNGLKGKYLNWKTLVEFDGPMRLRELKSLDDKVIRGVGGVRQSRLNIDYRVRYIIDHDSKRVLVEFVGSHNDADKE